MSHQPLKFWCSDCGVLQPDAPDGTLLVKCVKCGAANFQSCPPHGCPTCPDQYVADS